MADNMDRELDWGDEIENDGSDFVLLEEGEYPFIVTKFERGRSRGSDKMPPCNMAILTLRVNEQATLTEHLVLNTRLEWKLSQFFRSIGLKKHGEKLRMDWTKVLGASGRCKVIVDTYTGNDGKERETNRIDKFLDPEEGAAVQQTTPARKWTPGKF